MGFWRGEKLAQVLPGLISPFDAKNLDCASYKLSVGDQVFSTSDTFLSASPTAPLISSLSKTAPDNVLRIRPGQFAFLLTEEVVQVPNDAMAFISMRATFKFKGLINVSGFHVDPGWNGKLLFSVYNAGPGEVVVKRGQPLFLIVYSSLDEPTKHVYDGASQNQVAIDPSLLQHMTEQVFSPLMLQRKMDEIQRRMDDVQASANLVKSVALAMSSVAVIIIAAATLFAAFAPATLGVIIARMIDFAGYDMRIRPSEPGDRTATAVPAPTAAVQPTIASSPKRSPLPAKPAK